MKDRIIKYRGWDTVNEKMLPVESINFRENYISLNEGDNSLTDTMDMIELMQFTGLHDKHGNEIYEGDIVTLKSYNYPHLNNQYYKVEYYGEYVMFKFVSISDGKVYDRYGLFDIEIIGNIQETTSPTTKQ